VRILLIDDSASFRKEFMRFLAGGDYAGATVETATTAADGWARLTDFQPDICFVDIRLPGDSGLDLIRRARQAGVDQPLICLTGYDDLLTAVEAERAGASGYLPKDELGAPILERAIRFSLRLSDETPAPGDAKLQYRLAQKAANFGSWSWDPQSRTSTWDDSMYRLYGYATHHDAPEEIWRRAVDPATQRDTEETRFDSVQSGLPYQSDSRIKWPDGSIHYIRNAGQVIRRADGGRARLSGISMDVTALHDLADQLCHARDDAQSANRTKSLFLANMSHELRTPLNGILGYAELLNLEDSLTEQQRARVQAMQKAGQHLLEIINCVLDLSEIESTHMALKTAEIEVVSVAQAALDVVRPNAAQKGLTLMLETPPDDPCRVTTDPTRLRQIILNLLGNAVKYTRQGYVALRLIVIADRGMLRIEVVDTGPGVPPEYREKIFVEFERTVTAASSEIEGIGLGLALAVKLAGLLDGTLAYRDNPAGGSIFSLEIPVACALPVPAAVASSGEIGPEHPSAPTLHRTLRVLVVDDILMNRDIAASFLQTAGHQVICAESGPQAIAAAASTDFDVVLMDVRMPGMSGLEAAQCIRAIAGLRGTVPIVAMTAHAFVEQVNECHEAGMATHLAKPFEGKTLLATVVQAAAAQEPPALAPIRPRVNAAQPPPPDFDQHLFDQAVRALPREKVASCLRSLTALGEQLKQEINDSKTICPTDNPAGETAHKLGGSAGMFGFTCVSTLARAFDDSFLTGICPSAGQTQSLIDAVDLMTLRLMLLNPKRAATSAAIPGNRWH